MLKGKRTLTMHLEVTVDLGDVDFEYDQYSSLLHDQGVRKSHTQRLLKELADAIGFGIKEDVTIASKHSQLDIVMEGESEAEYAKLAADEWAAYESRTDAVHAVAERLGIKECIWSFSPRDIEGDYQQNLIDNIKFRDGQCRFEYDDHDKVNKCPAIFTDPTMEDVFMAADHCLRSSNDKHHVFVEGVEDKGVDSDGVRVYAFYYGS